MKAASPYDPWVVLQGPPNRSIGTSPRSRAQSIVSDTSPSTNNQETVLQHPTDDNMSSSSSSTNKMNGLHPPRDQSPRSISSSTSKEMTVDYVLSVFGGSGSPKASPKASPMNKDHRPAELSTFNADSFSKLHTLCAANTSIEMIRMYVTLPSYLTPFSLDTSNLLPLPPPYRPPPPPATHPPIPGPSNNATSTAISLSTWPSSVTNLPT